MNELHNAEAERAVLGALLIDPDAVREVSYFLEPDDFFVERNRWVYAVIVELAEDGFQPDYVTVADQLDRQGLLEDLGGSAYLTDLTSQVPSALRVKDYGRLVARRAIDRRLAAAAQTIAGLAYQDVDPIEKITQAEAALKAISIINGDAAAMNAEQAAKVLGDLAREYAANPLPTGAIRGRSMGITALDKMLRGWRVGLYLVGGVTHVGKTAFVTQLAVNVADAGGSVLFIETEDSQEAMWARIFAVKSELTFEQIDRGLHPEDLDWYEGVLEDAAEWDFEILAKPLTVKQIDQEVRARTLDLVVVDNIETPSMQYAGDGEWQRFRRAAYGLVSVVQESGVPLLTTMQVSRHKLGVRDSKMPQMDDLYGADGPAQAASVVLTLHRTGAWELGEDDGMLQVACWKDKLSHLGAGKQTTLQFGKQGQVRDYTPRPIEF